MSDRIVFWARGFWEEYGGVWGLIFLLVLIAFGAIMLILGDRERARDERNRYLPGYVERKAFERRWGWFLGLGLVPLIIASFLVERFQVPKLPLAAFIPGWFFAWSLALISADVMWQSKFRDWRGYVLSIWRMLVVGLSAAGIYWMQVRPLLNVLSPALRWIELAIGLILAPILFKLATWSPMDNSEAGQ